MGEIRPVKCVFANLGMSDIRETPSLAILPLGSRERERDGHNGGFVRHGAAAVSKDDGMSASNATTLQFPLIKLIAKADLVVVVVVRPSVGEYSFASRM